MNDKIPPGLTKADLLRARGTGALIHAICIGGGRDGKLRWMRMGEKRTVFGDDTEFYETRTLKINGRKKYFWVRPEVTREEFTARAHELVLLLP